MAAVRWCRLSTLITPCGISTIALQSPLIAQLELAIRVRLLLETLDDPLKTKQRPNRCRVS